MISQNTVNILIVGAGITGLALFRALQSNPRLNLTLIDKRADAKAEGAAICLPGNALRELKKLNVSDATLDIAHTVTRIEYALSTGKTLAQASLLEAPLNQAPFVSLMRSELVDILTCGLEDKLTSAIHFNTQIESVEHVNIEGLSKQRVRFVKTHNVAATRQDQSLKSQMFDLVVGCDGIHSQVRDIINPLAATKDLGVTNWRFIADMNEVLTADIRNRDSVMTDNASKLQPIYYIGNDAAFMIYPMKDNKVYCYGQVIDPNNVFFKEQPIEALKRIFSQYALPVQSVLTQLSNKSLLIKGKLQSVSQVKAVNDNMILLGDALHGCPPSLQQGAALALEDVNCLAELLNELKSLDDIPATLQQFEVRRLERIKWVVSESNKIIKLAGLGRFFLGRILRNAKIRKQGPANVVGWRKLMTDKAY